MKYILMAAMSMTLIVYSAIPIAAQAKTQRWKSAGGEVGFGNTFSNNTTYKLYLGMADFSFSFSQHPMKRDFVAWYMNPQFNLVKATNTKPNAWDVEGGVNLGIRNYVRVSEHFYLYQMLGSGPHFISARLDRQARGFIFSDNLDLGSFIQIYKNYFVNLQLGLRHISNASLKLPNRGVNSLLFMIGLSRVNRHFDKRG